MSLQPDRKSRRRRSSLTRIETLEPRTLLSGSTISVINTADSGAGSLRQALLDADALNAVQPASIVFNLPTTDPGYDANAAAWNFLVNSSLPTITGAGITIDASQGLLNVPGGISLSGSGNALTLIGNAGETGIDQPDAATTGSGLISLGGLSIAYSQVGTLSVANLASMSVVTPNSGNSLTVGSPSAGLSQINGSSGGTAIVPLSFSSIASLTLNAATNDHGSTGDSITIGSTGLLAGGLANFTVQTGPANDTLTVLATSLALPVAGGSFSLEGGSGYNTVVAQADVNYALTPGSLAIPGSGALALANIQNVQLTGGIDSTSFQINNWMGDLTLDGGPGTNQLLFQESGSFGGNLALSDFSSTTIQIQGNFGGTISAPQTTTIQQILISGNDLPGSSISAGAYVPLAGSTAPAVQVVGDLGGSILASENLSITGSGVLSSIEIDGNLVANSGQIWTGAIGTLTVGQDLAGLVVAEGGGTIGTITVGGNLSGTVKAPEDTTTGSGKIKLITVGGSLSGTISSGNISGIVVGADLLGVIIAEGAGTIGTVTVGGNLSGTVYAPEDPNPGSGKIQSVNVGGSLTGTISSGNISGIVVGADLTGVIIAEGAGTIGTVTVGGNLSGTVYAPEDPNPGSGTITLINVGGSLTGTISSGNISGIVVGADLLGVIIAEGAGTIGNVTVQGNLGGQVIAQLDGSATSGVIGSFTVNGTLTGLIQAVRQVGQGTVNSVGSTGSIQAGDVISSLTINANAGSISAGNVASFVGNQTIGGTVTLANLSQLSVRSLTGSFSYQTSSASGSIQIGNVAASGMLSGTSTQGGVSIGTLSGRVNLGAAGGLTYLAMAPGSELDASSVVSLTIVNDLAGVVNVSGDLQQLTVKSGSMLTGSKVIAGSLESATIGQNMAGLIQVSGTLGALKVGGATPGSIIAGHVGTISATSATGPLVLQVQENGVQRQLQAITPGNLYPSPGQTATGSLAQTSFGYVYESGNLASPQLTVQVSNHSGLTTPNQFDLSLVTVNGTAKFNLARLDAVGVSGIGNVTVEGDILTSVTSQARAFLSGDNTRAGIQLPLDALEGVGVRDFIPSGGYINAASLQAVSVGLVGTSWGASVAGANASAYLVQSLLSSSTRIVQAQGSFRVPFSGSALNQVGFFMDDTPWGGFDWANVAFTIQNNVGVNPAGTANVITQNNLATGTDMALIQVGLGAFGLLSQIQGINILGDGASLSTFQWINGPIVSTGSLGDLWLLNWQPIGNITASSIFGTITAYAQYSGTIQTTGIWTNPSTGDQSATPGDFGRTYLNAWNQLTTTTFTTYTGNYSGQLIVRGNLVSSVILNGGLSGTIAVLGNIGSRQGGIRTGGVVSNGNDTGTILAMGSIFADLTINGNLGKNATIAAGTGLLGSTTINGNFVATARIISGGAIGSASSGTSLTIYGNNKGTIACQGTLLEWSGNLLTATTVANSPILANITAIDAVFGGSATSLLPLTSFDSKPGSLDLNGLEAILDTMALIHVNKQKLLSVIAGS